MSSVPPEPFSTHLFRWLGGRLAAAAPDPRIPALEAQMATILEDLQELNQHFDASVLRAQKDHTALSDRISALQAKIDSGQASPAEAALIAEMKTKVDGLLPDPAGTGGGTPPPQPPPGPPVPPTP